MNADDILAAIDEKIARLREAHRLLSGGGEAVGIKIRKGEKLGRKIPGPKPKAGKRTMSAEGRARIAAAQRARWAKTKQN